MISIVPSVAVVCLLSVPAPLVAQQPPASAPSVEKVEKGSARATSGTPAPGGAAAAAPAPPYSYDSQGRRDPFLSLVARGSDPGSAATRPAGLPGLLIAEVAVKGIVRDRSGLIAMVQGPGTKTFIVHPGEKLMDGSVKAITDDSVVFSQDVNDPLSMVKQKEVRKTVRSADGGRE
jgi:Tfp pilus assembly protein PilP